MLKKDKAFVGSNESSWHALSHSYIQALLIANVLQKFASIIMSHISIFVDMDKYGHTFQTELLAKRQGN